MSKLQTIELLAPARDSEAARVAVDYGADALYIGGAKFGARHAAGNAAEEIARAVAYAHRFDVRVYATLNTLLYNNELGEAERVARELIDAGVDALIVQDMALRRMNLPVELHSSTQMCNCTPEQAAFLEQCGFARVILERALSLEEIRSIRAATNAEIECFVHGAICVCYSGRCFLSRSMSERSGNRGACSQPCRLTYDLVDANDRILLKGKHLLSVRDMNLSDRIGELIDAGVSSFKIEGRLKDTGYLKNVVSHYRRRIDEALQTRPGVVRASVGESLHDFEPDPAKSFTRGESEYFFDGRRAGVASFDTPKAIGEPLGRIASVDGRSFRLERPADLAAGDGICVVTPRGAVGTSVVRVEGTRVQPNRMEGITPGVELFRNNNLRFEQMLSRSRTRRVIPARAEVAVTQHTITLRFTDCRGLVAEVRREGVFEPAQDPVRMAETIRTQTVRSGDTIFAVREVSVSGTEWFVPVSLLGALRREGLSKLEEEAARRVPEHRILPEDPAARAPWKRLMAEENVTNDLAERFYRDHGVEEMERGLDLAPTTRGRRVMRTAYCIRREMGECLRRGSQLKGDLWLVRGAHRYRLAFDCRACEMSLIDETR